MNSNLLSPTFRNNDNSSNDSSQEPAFFDWKDCCSAAKYVKPSVCFAQKFKGRQPNPDTASGVSAADPDGQPDRNTAGADGNQRNGGGS